MPFNLRLPTAKALSAFRVYPQRLPRVVQPANVLRPSLTRLNEHAQLDGFSHWVPGTDSRWLGTLNVQYKPDLFIIISHLLVCWFPSPLVRPPVGHITDGSSQAPNANGKRALSFRAAATVKTPLILSLAVSLQCLAEWRLGQSSS